MRVLRIVAVLLLLPVAGFAQRTLYMTVKVKNNSERQLRVHRTPREFIGRLTCPGLTERQLLDPGKTLSVDCEAAAGSGRNETRSVTLFGTMSHYCARPECAEEEFKLAVYSGSHKFSCTRCDLKDAWNCSGSGRCSVTITITPDPCACPAPLPQPIPYPHPTPQPHHPMSPPPKKPH